MGFLLVLSLSLVDLEHAQILSLLFPKFWEFHACLYFFKCFLKLFSMQVCFARVYAVSGPLEEQAALQRTSPAFKCLEDRNEIPRVCIILTILRMLITCSA